MRRLSPEVPPPVTQPLPDKPSDVLAKVIRVPEDQPTIQAGIDVANDGSTVLVADGIYKGRGNVNIDFKGKAIKIKSVNGPESTIIDCENVENTRGFIFQSSETPSSILDGFTIKNGKHGFGGGINCHRSSSPTIANNIITGNLANAHGGGIHCSDLSEPVITNILVTQGM